MIADDFDAIRQRLEELRKQKAPTIEEPKAETKADICSFCGTDGFCWHKAFGSGGIIP